MEVRGPIAPPVAGAMENEIADVTPAVTGAHQHRARRRGGMQVFAGPRDDPFFIDLEAAFCILPDRRPVGGALSSSCALTPSQPGTPFFFRNPGVNYVNGFNVNSIVIELPNAQLEGSAPGGWASGARSASDHLATRHSTRRSRCTEALSSAPRAAWRSRRPSSAVGLAATACSDDDNDNTAPTTPRMFNQVQRLGNPLVSEVLLSKRSHPTHGSIGPDQDAALVAPEVVDFLTTVAGRDPAYIQAIAPALIPDVLVVDTSKDPSTAVGGSPRPCRRRVRRTQAAGRRRGPGAHGGVRRAPWATRRTRRRSSRPTTSADDSPNITSTFPYLAPPN